MSNHPEHDLKLLTLQSLPESDMNINENKFIDSKAPTLSEWIRNGKDVLLPELGDDYTLFLEYHEDKNLAYQYCVDKVRMNYNTTTSDATRIVNFTLKKLEMI